MTEQWGRYELALTGSTEGNPFLDVRFSATFSHRHRGVEVDGFYDGDGVYRVRFMPDTVGTWRYRTSSNLAELDGQEGEFTCVAPGPDNHGPVRVAGTYHFAYADGTPFKQVGTTCYVWNHQGDELEKQTLDTLRDAPFNKLRMCVFPKRYPYNQNEPPRLPFPRDEAGTNDFSRFEPEFFQHLERRIGDLQELGIEADLILFHPYDTWGYSTMDAETDDRYLRYVVARLASYRNIWWSMANEYDLMREKTMADWDRFFRVVSESDPYQHLRSIHNCHEFYDHGKPWVTHASIQHRALDRVREWRELYGKPVVDDECCYEGNIPWAWGNISAQELVHRFWEGTAQGGYVGHGETYLHPEDLLWWSKGGVLHGESPARIAFLRKVLEAGPARGLDPIDGVFRYRMFPCAGQPHEYYLTYFGTHQPAELTFDLPAGERYHAEVIDTWEMSVTPVGDTVVAGEPVRLPGKPYQALVLRRI